MDMKLDAAAQGLCAFAVGGGGARLKEAGLCVRSSLQTLCFTGLLASQRAAVGARSNPAVVRCADGVLQIVLKAPEVAPEAGLLLQQRLAQRLALGQVGQVLQEAHQDVQGLQRGSAGLLGTARLVLRRQLLSDLGDETVSQEERGALLRDAGEVLVLEAEALEAEVLEAGGETEADRRLLRTLQRLGRGELLGGELLRAAQARFDEREQARA